MKWNDYGPEVIAGIITVLLGFVLARLQSILKTIRSGEERHKAQQATNEAVEKRLTQGDAAFKDMGMAIGDLKERMARQEEKTDGLEGMLNRIDQGVNQILQRMLNGR